MRIESDGHSRGNPRLFEVIEGATKETNSKMGNNTVWAWPELLDHLRVAGQPVQGPWPPHQQPRPEPEEDMSPVAVRDPQGRGRPAGRSSSPTPRTPAKPAGPSSGRRVSLRDRG
ncbi:MAG: hypothetical protein ACRDX8_07290 [Acidimicrobiales bacterium]